MQHLDRQLYKYREQLVKEIGLSTEESSKVVSHIAADVRFLPVEAKNEIQKESPVSISKRIEELKAYEAFASFASSVQGRPEIIRALVIVQNYICFCYLRDACF